MASKRMDAARAGEIHYEGNPCRNCGATRRYTLSGACVACVSKRSTEHKRRFKELVDEVRALKAEAAKGA